jgi:Conserved oligomeric complex COG6
MRQFHLLMAEKAHTVTLTLDDDLAPPVFFMDAVTDLRTILTAYDSSMTPIARDDQEIHAIIESALSPYLRQCEGMVEPLVELSQCIMLANCYDLAIVLPLLREKLIGDDTEIVSVCKGRAGDVGGEYEEYRAEDCDIATCLFRLLLWNTALPHNPCRKGKTCSLPTPSLLSHINLSVVDATIKRPAILR